VPPSIEEQLQGKSASERALIKAQALADAAPGNKRVQFTQDGITYVVTGWYVDADGAFCVTVTASDANGPIPTDNLYRFINPPIKVPDGTTRTEIGRDGQQRQLRNFTEDLLGAAKQIIIDAVGA
jgi:hypothetical protein